MPIQFTVKLDNQPDALAELLQLLAARGVDLRSIGFTRVDNQAAAVFTTNHDALTCEALTEYGYAFFAGEVVITSVPDTPGAFADIAGRLAGAGIGVHGVVLLRWYQGKAELALSVDDPVAARTALAVAPVVRWRRPAPMSGHPASSASLRRKSHAVRP
jgi:hypothetical protein